MTSGWAIYSDFCTCESIEFMPITLAAVFLILAVCMFMTSCGAFLFFIFQEMEAAGTVDATTQPVVLFGPDTAQFGAVAGAYPAGWKDQLAGKALHAILEGCEPSSGLR